MKRWVKYIALAIWMFLFDYLGDVFQVPKNIYYFLIGLPLLLGGGFLIFYLFDRGERSQK